MGTDGRRRAAPPRRPQLASPLRSLTSVGDIQRELRRQRDEARGDAAVVGRTSVMTHVAWVPEQWREAALATLAGLGEAHPSRSILLLPEPGPDDAISGSVELWLSGRDGAQIGSEVITIRLRGTPASAPASVVLPLLRSDLPVFLRWRGPLEHAARSQLVALADRLIVDSGEWPDVPAGLAALARSFDAVAVSDIGWARLAPWRSAIAALWPAVAGTATVRVVGPAAEARLLAGWLCDRLAHPVELMHEPASELQTIELDGVPLAPVRADAATPSELLSHELEIFTRDRIYEQAVLAAVRAA